MFYVGGTSRIKHVIAHIDYSKMPFCYISRNNFTNDSINSNSTSSRGVKSNINSQIMRLCIYFESTDDELVS